MNEFSADFEELVSVVMASRGDVAFIQEAINSVLEQDYEHLELILVDYGGGAAITASAHIRDPRLRTVRTSPSSSKAEALNTGLETAQGEIVALIDGDDIWKPGKLRAQLEYMQTHPSIGILGTQVERFGEWGGPSRATRFPEHPDSVRRSLTKGVMPIQQSSMLLRSGIIQKIGGYATRCLRCEDLELLIRASEITQIANLSEVYISYRVVAPGQPWSYWKTNEEWRRLAVLSAKGKTIEDVSRSRRWWWREVLVLRLFPYYLLARWRDGGFS